MSASTTTASVPHRGADARRRRTLPPRGTAPLTIVAAPAMGYTRTYRRWTDAEDAFLVHTHQTLLPAEQARELRRPVSSVAYRRSYLYAIGRIHPTERLSQPAWSPMEDAELHRLIQEGWPLVKVAEQLQRPYFGVCQRTARFGGVRAMRGQTIQVRSLLAVARLFGVPLRMPDLWRRKRWLTVRRNRDLRRPTAKTRTYLVSDTAIQAFLAVREGWATWEPRTISDPDWRAEAEAIRAQATGAWLTYPEIAACYGVEPKRVAEWARRGDIDAIKIGRTHFVWSETLAGFVPPGVRYRGRGQLADGNDSATTSRDP